MTRGQLSVRNMDLLLIALLVIETLLTTLGAATYMLWLLSQVGKYHILYSAHSDPVAVFLSFLFVENIDHAQPQQISSFI